MTLTLANITGTVTVAFEGGEQVAVGLFEVPVTATLDADGYATLNAAPDGAIRQAMANALNDAATRLLAGLPAAELDYELDGTIIRCDDCGATCATTDATATLKHGEDGAHIFSPGHGDGHV